MAQETHDPKHGNVFASLAKRSAKVLGSAPPFGVVLGVIVIWAATGPVFDFSDTWQLIINTGTTIVTFLMVFLIQNTQNRDSEAIQIKLDELIRSTRGAHNAMIDLEELNQEDLDKIKVLYEQLGVKARGLDKKVRRTRAPRKFPAQ